MLKPAVRGPIKHEHEHEFTPALRACIGFPRKNLQTNLIPMRLSDEALLPIAGYTWTIWLDESVHGP
jgi:hypothetical protein